MRTVESEDASCTSEDIPETWDDLEDWVDRRCSGRLVLLPSAVKAARESTFEDIPLAYRSLLLLANECVNMRTRAEGEEDFKTASDRSLLDLGVECGPVGTAVDSRLFKAGYRKLYKGQEIRLDMHLKRGAGFDPKLILRVYFHYSEELLQVIVGHMPSHLTNRKSRNA
ncbi:hypothetical protein [Luteimonas sp. 100069]|uniref:hypothetical protein n=1 Tax=Luteimonas sp. 100069 TaxID=2006109 RepID=UPI000F504B0A|nr:hypothetical protein [Luteimonas sp. 100069]